MSQFPCSSGTVNFALLSCHYWSPSNNHGTWSETSWNNVLTHRYNNGKMTADQLSDMKDCCADTDGNDCPNGSTNYAGTNFCNAVAAVAQANGF